MGGPKVGRLLRFGCEVRVDVGYIDQVDKFQVSVVFSPS